ncbi:MAG: TonB-dependent receptor [Cyclobacteriaceae bacterium]|uniref:TonB-dependent receptor n=1 Tax=Nonlabens ulvanivorans TaxID=906888 RepID=UPI0032766116
MLKTGLLALTLLANLCLFAQDQISGHVINEKEEGIPQANIQIKNSTLGATTDQDGYFSLRVRNRDSVTLVISHVQYLPLEYPFINNENGSNPIHIQLTERTRELEGVEVRDQMEINEVQSVTKIDSKSAKSLPSTFGDFNKILVTLPGVAGNNELSSAYSVRGGNFDENLVYVNDIPVYRPFLSNAGRQEGLSFVNPDMVQNIEFYAGGWEAKYGDKLSSSLNIEYKEPDTQEGGVTIGLLGGTAFYGGKSGRVSHMTGIRHKDSRYLLNTLKTQGQYFPTYTDIQSMLTFDLTNKNSPYIYRTKLNLLLSYGRNRYLTQPVSQETQFGSIQANFRLQTAFIGRELLNYDTYQAGFRLTHRFTNKFRSHIIGSGLFTYEREQFDVEGAYRLCDVNTNSSSRFDDCVVVRGIGTNYDYGRNSLRANLFTFENRNEYLLSEQSTVELGFGASFQKIEDEVNEYSFLDSADYVHIQSSIFNNINLNSIQYFAYLQNTIIWGDSAHAVTIGGRINYWDYNEQLLFSPRVAYRFVPDWEKPTTFKISVGYYQQPPFYRELRDYDGNLKDQVLAQKSIHYIGSVTRVFKMWGRPFLFNSDVYYKKLYDIIPYDIDNVRIRYFPTNNAEGYAAGFDFRVNGEFVKGTQSWFSIGFLRTMENLTGDSYTQYFDEEGNEIPSHLATDENVDDTKTTNIGYIRRPMDQLINLAVYFEDHMPNDPSLRVHLNMVFGSGYPFGPPKAVRYRNAFKGDEYYRVDLGLSKTFERNLKKMFPSVMLRIELLNALGADNTLSYTWIEDVNGNNFAIPNSLSARFLNIKLSAEL